MNKATAKTGLAIALAAGGIVTLVSTVHGQGIGQTTLDRLTMGTPQQVDRGEQVFDDQCAECHGDQGIEATEIGQRLGAEGFVDTEVERSGIYSIYDVVSFGYEYEDGEHPAFENLRYQDRWAVSHYTQSLIDDPQPDPQELIDRVRRQAMEGVCDPEIREEVGGFARPESDEQITAGQDIYDAQCASCHGDDGRADVPAAQTNPPARDFHQPAGDWTNGTSPFAIYETLDNGIEGTAMAAYGHLPDEDLWALVHYVREELVLEGELQEVTEEEIDAVCRSMSAPPAPDPIPVDRAMDFLIDDAEQERYVRLLGYGDPVIQQDADFDRGEELFSQSCASCHGAEGQATDSIGPYGKFPPYLSIEPGQLVPASVGGTYEDVAQRVIYSAHASLPDRPTVASYSENDWRDLQAWITTFDGEGSDRVRTVSDIDEAQQYLVDETDDIDDTDDDDTDDDVDDGDEESDADDDDNDGEPDDQ